MQALVTKQKLLGATALRPRLAFPRSLCLRVRAEAPIGSNTPAPSQPSPARSTSRAQVVAAVAPAPARRFGNLPLALPDVPPELVAIALVYFVQGILELAGLAQTYYLKDELHADPAQVAIFMSIAGIPWTIKPLIGFISDTLPLFGYRRRSYLMLASAAGAASFMAMSKGGSSPGAFLAAMAAASAASAVSDVVVDSMVVERARTETTETAGSLQSLCWASYAVAQVVTASLAGSLVQSYGPRFVFELTSMFPLLVGVAALLVHEERADAAPNSAAHSKRAAAAGSAGAAPAAVATSQDATPATAAPATGTSALQGVVSEHASAVWTALKRPDMLAPLAFLLLLSATPSADPAMFFYQTDVLGFTPSFLGQVQLAAACASFVGVLLYSSFLKGVPVRTLMLWGTLLGAVLQSSQLILVTGLHRQLGLDDHLFVLGGSVVMDIIQNILSMPTMVLAARLCPPGIEATMFATIMSLMNLADGVRMGGGAALMSGLHVTADDLSQMPVLLAICNAALLLPLTMLGQIPAKFDSDVPVGTPTSSSESSFASASLTESVMSMDMAGKLEGPAAAAATAEGARVRAATAAAVAAAAAAGAGSRVGAERSTSLRARAPSMRSRQSAGGRRSSRSRRSMRSTVSRTSSTSSTASSTGGAGLADLFSALPLVSIPGAEAHAHHHFHTHYSPSNSPASSPRPSSYGMASFPSPPSGGVPAVKEGTAAASRASQPQREGTAALRTARVLPPLAHMTHGLDIDAAGAVQFNEAEEQYDEQHAAMLSPTSSHHLPVFANNILPAPTLVGAAGIPAAVSGTAGPVQEQLSASSLGPGPVQVKSSSSSGWGPKKVSGRGTAVVQRALGGREGSGGPTGV